MEYDVVIKSHKKDYNKLTYTINSFKYLNPFPQNIYLVTEDGFVPNCNYTDIIIPIKDADVYPNIDRNKIHYRNNWCWANIVSITQEFTKNDKYFDVQSDNFFLKKVDLVEDGKIKLFKTDHNLNNNLIWKQYFSFSQELFGIDKLTLGSSYITEFIMYDREKLKILWSDFDSKQDAIDKMYNNINEFSYPADQEIYGNLVEKYYLEDYVIENVDLKYHGGWEEPTNENIEKYLVESMLDETKYLACSYHTYWIPE
jgi:hypothetical protein